MSLRFDLFTHYLYKAILRHKKELSYHLSITKIATMEYFKETYLGSGCIHLLEEHCICLNQTNIFIHCHSIKADINILFSSFYSVLYNCMNHHNLCETFQFIFLCLLHLSKQILFLLFFLKLDIFFLFMFMIYFRFTIMYYY